MEQLEDPFQITNLDDLQALQRALLEARFYSGAMGPEVPGSPVVADLHRRTVEAIAKHYASSGNAGAVENMARWRRWSNRDRERNALVAILTSMKPWGDWPAERRAEVARSLVVPFIATEDELADLVRAEPADP